jgi:hypothetical protein
MALICEKFGMYTTSEHFHRRLCQNYIILIVHSNIQEIKSWDLVLIYSRYFKNSWLYNALFCCKYNDYAYEGQQIITWTNTDF